MQTSLTHILEKIDAIDPVAYGRNRNFIDGSVTQLSPYISRGVISTKQVLETVLSKGYKVSQIEKFVQELAWRDYWQQIWVEEGDLINKDYKKEQLGVKNHSIPLSIINGNTSILAIDNAIKDFYKTGYLHNHLRMYIASIACNVAKSHWKIPAQWMYYHLLDADWASNNLSWQWVCGSNSNKLYYANQDNINKYCYTIQKNTFLDVDYQEFYSLEIPEELRSLDELKLETPLPKNQNTLKIQEDKPTLVYNFYNLDPNWKKNIHANRVLLIEPSVFKHYPISKKSMDFMIDLSKNINNVQLFVGEYDELKKQSGKSQMYFKDHPLNKNYDGIEEKRDWMFSVKGSYPSFFKFWNKCKKEL